MTAPTRTLACAQPTDPVVYRDYDQAGLDAQYNNQQTVDNFRGYIDRYRALSDEAKRTLACTTGLRYGPSSDETLDIYGPPDGRLPVLVFLHGGAWQLSGKDDSAFMAPAFVGAGALLVALNFSNVPAVTVDTMVSQVRRAVAWLWHNVAAHGGDPSRLYLAGHSSGSHLLSQCLTADWSAEGVASDQVIRGAVFTSGLCDLEPVRLSYRNQRLKLDTAAVRRLSLIHQQPTVRCPLIVAFADSDTDEFRRQTLATGDYWRAHGNPVQTLQLSGKNHYDMVLDLADPGSALFAACASMMALKAQIADPSPTLLS